MANNIYDISDWSAATVYKKNNVVKYLNNYFYSLINSNVGNTPSVESSFWGGNANDPIDNTVKPEFIWYPSFSLNIDISPRVKTIKFGDGFDQSLSDGINSSLLNIECTFDGRDIEEATAILHFLSARQGTQTYLWTLPPPFSKKKRWKSQDYPASINFWNNNSIKCIMREVVV